MLYNNLSGYLRDTYGKRLKKICIDAGFTCPNRDGKCGTGGCIYCGEEGAGEHIDKALSITDTVKSALEKATPDDLFIAYFQSFSNTYSDIATLKARYDAALIDDRIKILAIGTRADCIDEEVCKLLSEYNKKYEVWVELGLQTANDKTAEIINRGYPLSVFESAYNMLASFGLKVVVHLIIGLPGESDTDIKASADYVASTSPFGVKIHSIYVMRGTVLEKMYLEKRYTPPSLDEYSRLCAYTISVMPKSVVIHRITGDAPRDSLVAPLWNSDKHKIIASVNEELEKIKGKGE